MSAIIEEIDVAIPLNIHEPFPVGFENAIPLEIVVNRGYDQLSEFYGVNMRELVYRT
ncbi:MAG: hypothetical protein LBN18_00805 [Dysgonamonadaceae bacterium]|jgi:hypothetical protein|nr:hypothetical protein [Dysgonamonadaceae bacterium]